MPYKFKLGEYVIITKSYQKKDIGRKVQILEVSPRYKDAPYRVTPKNPQVSEWFGAASLKRC